MQVLDSQVAICSVAPFSERHLAEMCDLVAAGPMDPTLSAGIPCFHSPHEADEWYAQIEDGRAQGSTILYAVLVGESGRLAGTVRLRGPLAAGVAQLSYWVAPSYRNRRLATAGAAQAIGAIDRLHGRHFRISSFVHCTNAASIRVLDKLGFVPCRGLDRRPYLNFRREAQEAS